MNQADDPLAAREFNVKVGLAECVVTCQSEKEAVQLARARLGEKMPQMWDIIQGLADKQFHVHPVR